MVKFLTKRSASGYFHALTTIFSCTLIATSLVFFFNKRSDFRNTASYEIKTQNHNIRQQITDSLSYSKQIMTYVGKQISIHNVHNYKFINRLLVNYRIPREGMLSWSVFAWVDKNHQLQVSSGIGVFDDPIDLTDRQYIRHAEKNPETMHVGNPIIGRVSKVSSIPMSYGIVNSHREYLGSVIVGLVLNNLESQINSVISNNDVLFAIIDGNGKIAAKSKQLNDGRNKKALDNLMKNIKENSRQEISSNFTYYQRLIECDVDCVNYGIITIYNKDTVAHRESMRWTIYLLIASFSIAVAGFMLFSFYEHIINPISILSKFAYKVSRNEPVRQTPKFKVKELDQLAKAIAVLGKKNK